MKRALNQGSDELSQNRKHHVVQESNKRNYTKILRSSSALVKDAQQDNISVTPPRRSPRLFSKVLYPLFCSFRGGLYIKPYKMLRFTNTIIPLQTWIYIFCVPIECQNIHYGPSEIIQKMLRCLSFLLLFSSIDRAKVNIFIFSWDLSSFFWGVPYMLFFFFFWYVSWLYAFSFIQYAVTLESPNFDFSASAMLWFLQLLVIDCLRFCGSSESSISESHCFHCIFSN